MTTKLRLAVVTLLLTPTLCLAWGADGHRIVGETASHYLSPEAKAAVKGLLGDAGVGRPKGGNRKVNHSSRGAARALSAGEVRVCHSLRLVADIPITLLAKRRWSGRSQ